MAQKGECVPVQPLHGSGAEYRLCLDAFMNPCNLDLRAAGFGDFIYRLQILEVGQKLGTVGPIQVSRLQVVFLEEACETFSAGRSNWAVANREISGHDIVFDFLH